MTLWNKFSLGPSPLQATGPTPQTFLHGTPIPVGCSHPGSSQPLKLRLPSTKLRPLQFNAEESVFDCGKGLTAAEAD